MDIFSQVSDHSLFESSSSLSDACSSTAPPTQAAHSDVDEVLLATSRPKKRSGRRIFKETRHPIFRGVRRRNNNKWVCELREPIKKTRIWLGTYPTPEMAARAHDVAALTLRGKSACLNFPDSVWRLPLPASTDAKDIRKAAAKAAEEFRPRAHEMEVSHVEKSDVKLKEVEKTLQENTVLPENVFYVDEEAVFDMPGLLVNMAEGMLLSPPPLLLGDDDDDYIQYWDDCCVESDGCVSLWSHPI